MTNNYSIRKASFSDVSFLADAIIGAEKSNSDKLGLATLFNLSEDEVKKIIINILEEEVDGCEFSLSSFLVVEINGQRAAALAGWIEGEPDGIPSKMLRSNCIWYAYPKESLEYLQSRSEVISSILIEREKGSLQFEYLYVDENHRGNNLGRRLFEEHTSRAKSSHPDLKVIQLQVFHNNTGAIRLYERMGFKVKSIHGTDNKEVLNYLPDNKKVLMENS